jgi:putative membrane protein
MLWWKAFHIIFVVAWFAGLFYLPRLFVYHAQTTDVPGHERFVIMERRLFALMTIAASATLASGAWLALPYRPFPPWLWWKLGVVGVLLIHHALCWRYMRAFALGANRHGHRFYRVFNEIPTLALIGAVLLVVLKRP